MSLDSVRHRLLLFSVVFLSLVGLMLSPAWSANGEGGAPIKDAAAIESAPDIPVIGSLDWGELAFPQGAKGQLSLERARNLPTIWKIGNFPGWQREGKNDSLNLSAGLLPANLEVTLSLFADKSGRPTLPREARSYRARLIFAAEGRQVSFARLLEPGTHQIIVPVSEGEFSRAIHLSFVLLPPDEAPVLQVYPRRLDLGSSRQAETASRQLRLNNRGTEMLRWTASVAPLRESRDRRFFSLHGPIPQKEPYQLPLHLQPLVELTGRWVSENGYPAVLEAPATIRIIFGGLGITLINPRLAENTDLSVTINNEEAFWQWEDEERMSVLTASRRGVLPDGPQELLVNLREGTFFLEGWEVNPFPMTRLPAGRLRLFPRQGTTSRETDFITVNVDTRNLAPAVYFDLLDISSNGGQEQIPLYLEILPGGRGTFQEVFLYVNRAQERLLTSDPQVDARRIFVGAYQRVETAFQLFSPGTPGTTPFFRWYNPRTGDYFYSHDRQGAGKNLSAYLFEGSIGNIATSRLSGTRPLHRWFNRREERHFYTLDARGDEPRRRGFAYEGIAGFVR
jgi:hypothetical protein